jgi:zinc transporter
MLVHDAAELALTDNALICGFELREEGAARELRAGDVAQALQSRDGVTWLHFSLSNTRAAHFLATTPLVPSGFKALLAERVARPLIEADEQGLLLAMNDLSFDQPSDSSEVATLWAFATPRLVISARTHPLKSADQLRQQLRDGLRVASGIELVAHVLELRIRALREESDSLAEEVHEIEDRILSGQVPEQRERLGRVRRRCARIRRHFAHDRAALQKLVARPPAWFAPADGEHLKEVADEFAFLLDDVEHLYERAKLLQEELAGRLAEDTGTRLYVLSVLSAVILPMTFITGIFGMNVAGLPGLEGEASFWWTMFLIVAAGAAMLGLLRWRKLL